MAGDLYGPLSLSYGRKRGVSVLQDLNHNPSVYGGPGYLGPAPEGAIRFEEDGKASSSEGLDSSQEDLSHVWSDEDSDQYVLRRRRLVDFCHHFLTVIRIKMVCDFLKFNLTDF